MEMSSTLDVGTIFSFSVFMETEPGILNLTECCYFFWIILTRS